MRAEISSDSELLNRYFTARPLTKWQNSVIQLHFICPVLRCHLGVEVLTEELKCTRHLSPEQNKNQEVQMEFNGNNPLKCTKREIITVILSSCCSNLGPENRCSHLTQLMMELGGATLSLSKSSRSIIVDSQAVAYRGEMPSHTSEPRC